MAQPLDIAANLDAVQARIDAAARRVDRDPSEVRLIPVSKTVFDDRIADAAAAGVRLVGENKVQEARRKAELFADLSLDWAMIGHLQSNKVRQVVGSAAELHSLDRASLAEALDRRLQSEGLGLDVFIQVNSSREPSKFGLDPSEVLDFARSLDSFSGLRVRGLMTLAVFSGDVGEVRRCFRLMAELRDQLQQEVKDPERFGELSMGMSNDFEVAVEEGATTVRVGEAIFGPRGDRPADYWPGTER
jgi:pyridoxal phosphate enzyme (YggS family)